MIPEIRIGCESEEIGNQWDSDTERIMKFVCEIGKFVSFVINALFNPSKVRNYDFPPTGEIIVQRSHKESEYEHTEFSYSIKKEWISIATQLMGVFFLVFPFIPSCIETSGIIFLYLDILNAIAPIIGCFFIVFPEIYGMSEFRYALVIPKFKRQKFHIVDIGKEMQFNSKTPFHMRGYSWIDSGKPLSKARALKIISKSGDHKWIDVDPVDCKSKELAFEIDDKVFMYTAEHPHNRERITIYTVKNHTKKPLIKYEDFLRHEESKKKNLVKLEEK